MKVATCKKCRCNFAKSLDDAAFGGKEFELCEFCRSNDSDNEAENKITNLKERI